MKQADSYPSIAAIVTQFTFNGFGGGAGSNEGYITIKPIQNNDPLIKVYLTGPGKNAYLDISVDEYMRRVNAIYNSYNHGTSITLTLRYDDGLPLIIDITA